MYIAIYKLGNGHDLCSYTTPSIAVIGKRISVLDLLVRLATLLNLSNLAWISLIIFIFSASFLFFISY